MDYGLERIQFSAFFGKLNRNRCQELALRLRNELGNESGRVRIIPVSEQDLERYVGVGPASSRRRSAKNRSRGPGSREAAFKSGFGAEDDQ